MPDKTQLRQKFNGLLCRFAPRNDGERIDNLGLLNNTGTDNRLDALRDAVAVQGQVYEALQEWASSQDTYTAFVHTIIGKPGRMLTYVRDSHFGATPTGVMDAIAKLSGRNLVIYQADDKGVITPVHAYTSDTVAPTIALIHTAMGGDELNHFDLLEGTVSSIHAQEIIEEKLQEVDIDDSFTMNAAFGTYATLAGQIQDLKSQLFTELIEEGMPADEVGAAIAQIPDVPEEAVTEQDMEDVSDTIAEIRERGTPVAPKTQPKEAPFEATAQDMDDVSETIAAVQGAARKRSNSVKDRYLPGRPSLKEVVKEAALEAATDTLRDMIPFVGTARGMADGSIGAVSGSASLIAEAGLLFLGGAKVPKARVPGRGGRLVPAAVELDAAESQVRRVLKSVAAEITQGTAPKQVVSAEMAQALKHATAPQGISGLVGRFLADETGGMPLPGFSKTVIGEGTLPAPKVARQLRDCARDVEGLTGTRFSEKQLPRLKDALRSKKFTELPQAEKVAHRNKYTKAKRLELIKEWREHTHQEWPSPLHQVHHIIPQELGGPHEWWNIHPALVPDHQGGIHKAGSALRVIVKDFGK